jgi:hypothetical protein
VKADANGVAQINLVSVNLIAQLKVNQNYLFEDYQSKSGIPARNLILRSTAYYKEVERDMVISIC